MLIISIKSISSAGVRRIFLVVQQAFLIWCEMYSQHKCTCTDVLSVVDKFSRFLSFLSNRYFRNAKCIFSCKYYHLRKMTLWGLVECVMIVNLKNHMDDQQLETCWKFAEMHSMPVWRVFENIIVQYDWRIYKYEVSTILKIQWSTEQKSTKQSSNWLSMTYKVFV